VRINTENDSRIKYDNEKDVKTGIEKMLKGPLYADVT